MCNRVPIGILTIPKYGSALIERGSVLMIVVIHLLVFSRLAAISPSFDARNVDISLLYLAGMI